MLKITDSNYEEFKKVNAIIWSHIAKHIPQEIIANLGSSAPTQILAEWEKTSMSRAKAGLKIGLQDMLIQLAEMKEEDRQAIDLELKENRLPSLVQLLSAVKNIPARVLKRGRIKDLEEWYVIKESLDDVDSGLQEEEREKLGRLFVDFEQMQGRK